MELSQLPTSAAWRHHGARDGFEVLFVDRLTRGGAGSPLEGTRLRGATTARESGVDWAVRYDIALGQDWSTRSALISADVEAGSYTVEAVRDESGRWRIDGEPRPDLDGCLDIDLECSAVTNTLPLHRLPLLAGQRVEVPAVFVHAATGAVTRLEQSYRLLRRGPDAPRVEYTSTTFDFEATLSFDAAGLILDYPGLATRI